MQAGRGVTTGAYNTAVGMASLYSEDVGTKNTAVGAYALLNSNHSGATSHNTAIGGFAGYAVTTGTYNTLLGSYAGEAITTGDKNVVVGYDAETSAVGTDNEIVIGTEAAGSGANSIVIGNTSHTNARVYGLRTPVTAITADTSLTANDSGETFVFNDADGAVLTLPDSGDGSLTGVYFNFFIAVTATSNAHKVVCTDTTNEKLYGQVLTVDTDTSDANASFAAQAGDSFSAISSNGGTTGIIGSNYTITNVAADKWLATGNIHCTGAPATPFATS